MKWRDRNQQLLEQLPALRRYARALTGNQLSADELVQDCYERACGKFSLWRRGSNLRRWLFTIMHNLYVNQLRSEINKPLTTELDEDLLITQASVDTESNSELLALDKALDKLSVPQREVLILVCLEEMSYEEVAHTLNVPLGTVMSRLSRARENLRILMSRPKQAKLKRIK